ncbi:MAG: hypothetical protein CSA68_03815 [Rhodobacterales bacterium]|nr:MAG: hypothetical protein CSA68_03815 [Rhodobacterales bacterium]
MKQKTSDKNPEKTSSGPSGKAQIQSDREKRLKAALKENMKRRKAQLRARKAPVNRDQGKAE